MRRLNVKKCSRCGTLYDIRDISCRKEDVTIISLAADIDLFRSGIKYETYAQCNLCDKCTKSFADWFNAENK